MDFNEQRQFLLERKKRFANQAQYQNPESQMVGGHFIAPNPLQYLAAGLRSIGGMTGEKYANEELQALGKKERDLMASETKALAQALRGTDGQIMAPATPNDDEGNIKPLVQTQGAKGGYDAFMNRAMESPLPQIQDVGMKGMLSNAQMQAEQAKKARQMQIYADILKGSAPQEAIANGVPPEMVKQYFESPNYGRPKIEFKDVGGKLVPVTEYGDTPKNVAAMDKTGNPFSDLVVRGADGQMVPNVPLVGTKTGIARAGKPIVNVDARNFNTQESEQSKAYGKTLGEMRGAITQAGFDANSKIGQLNRMEQLLGSLDAGGKAAPLMADVASVAQSMGIKIDPNLGSKEAAQALAIEMANNMRQPGTGPMTDKDFDNFLRRVPDLSKTQEGRKQITSTMRSALQRDMQAAKFARDYAAKNNGVIDDNFYDAVAEFYNNNPIVKIPMPSNNARGSAFADPSKEQRYQDWLKSKGAR